MVISFGPSEIDVFYGLSNFVNWRKSENIISIKVQNGNQETAQREAQPINDMNRSSY